ncbi:MAG: hypothetical protein L3J44_01010 [Campylobacteraceae bacterium]|nr:hypothetical protein [Campylobacteraceae bacterium]
MKKQLNSDTILGLKEPARMCVVCTGRFSQKILYRFQVKNGKIIRYKKEGRSFYICKNCIKSDEKKVRKIVIKKFRIKSKNIEEFGNILKELDTNG